MANNINDLPPLGTISYTISAGAGGSFTFNGTTETVEFEVRPVYDLAERTVIYSNYTMGFRTIINALPVDPEVTQAVAVLQKPAGVLQILNHGLGNLPINLLNIKDVVWGPKPIGLSVKPWGGAQTTELLWRVQFGIPTCDDAVFTGAPMEFCYKVTFDIDRSGYTTRRYSAVLRIPQTRKSPLARTLVDSADAYRDQMIPRLLPGFRRVSQSFPLSYDKCSINGEIVDEEMPPNIPASGIVQCEASHSYSSVPQKQVIWTGTISGTYEIVKGAGSDIASAWNDFFTMAKNRMDILDTTLKGKEQPGCWVPLSFRAEEPTIFDKTRVRLEMSYTVVDASINDIIEKAGLWLPLKNLWVAWIQTGLGKGAVAMPFLDDRGNAGLVFQLQDDGIVDLCGQSPEIVVSTPPTGTVSGFPTSPSGSPTGTLPNFDQQIQKVFPWPSQNQSWLDFENHIFTECDQGNLIGQTLPAAPIPASQVTQQMWDSLSSQFPQTTNQGTLAFPPAGDLVATTKDSGSQTFSQQRVPPVLYITITGSALRAVYPIPMPNLIMVNGQAVTPANRVDRGEGFAQGVVAVCANGVQIYGAAWRNRYAVTTPFGGPMPVPPNPLLTSQVVLG